MCVCVCVCALVICVKGCKLVGVEMMSVSFLFFSLSFSDLILAFEYLKSGNRMFLDV